MEEAAFDQLHRALVDEVYRYAARRTSHDVAQDVVSEVFVALWVGRSRIPRDEDEQRAWVFGVARRQLARAQAAESQLSRLRATLRSIMLRDSPTLMEDVAMGVIQATEARSLWQNLSRKDQEILSLTVWERLEPQEIARVLNISVTAVTSRLHRARQRLDLLQKIQDDRARES